MTAKYEVQYDPDMDLRIARVLKPVVIDELRQIVVEHFDAPIAKYVIWNFYPGTMQKFSVDELKDLMPWRREALEQRAGGMSIQVAADEAERQLLTWYENFTRLLPFHSVRFVTCSSEEEALEIVRKDVGAS